MDEQMYSQQELGDLHRRNQELIIKCLVLLKAVEENPGLLTPERWINYGSSKPKSRQTATISSKWTSILVQISA